MKVTGEVTSVLLLVCFLSTVCERVRKRNQDGRQSFRWTQTNRKPCGAKSKVPPLCSDDDWVSRCPSGCRLQGLIQHLDQDLDRTLMKVCEKSRMYGDATATAMRVASTIYDHDQRVAAQRRDSELKFVGLAEGLTRNLTSLRKRSADLWVKLEQQLRDVEEQVNELYRTEVDVDMKLRSCRGSCRWSTPFVVDHAGFQTLRTQLDQTLTQRRKVDSGPADVPRIKLQPGDRKPDRRPGTRSEDAGPNWLVLDKKSLDPEELE